MRALLLLVTLLAPACRAADKNALTTSCDALKKAAAIIGVDNVCKTTAAAGQYDAFKGHCTSLTTAADALSKSQTCSEYTTNVNALCDAIVACTFGGSSNPCFPSNAIVTKADGSLARIDSLKEGDSLLAMTTDGKLMTDSVSLLSIAEPSRMSDFVTLATDAGAKLNLTAGHHIAVGPSCCSNLKKAKDVAVGESVWVMAAGRPLPVAQKVVSKGIVHETGLHSPVLTHGGLPIVSGFVTAFDSLEVVKAAQAGLAAMIQLCKASNTCDTVLKGMFRTIDSLRTH